MIAAGSLLFVAIAAGGLAVIVLRSSWHLGYRSPGRNAVAWALMGLAILLAWHDSGAWGTAATVLSIMGAAYAALLSAALAPSGTRERPPGRDRRTRPPRRPLHPARRFATFAIVGLGGLAGAIAVAIALRALAIMARAGEADANALALFAAPLAYAMLTFALLMSHRRSVQFRWLGACIAIAAPAIVTGTAS